jgi:26S proteasome regulatory subunit N9
MLYKLQIAPTEFYRNSLLYLVYTPLETMQLADQQSLAFDIGLAALVSPDIYNFGDLVS